MYAALFRSSEREYLLQRRERGGKWVSCGVRTGYQHLARPYIRPQLGAIASMLENRVHRITFTRMASALVSSLMR